MTPAAWTAFRLGEISGDATPGEQQTEAKELGVAIVANLTELGYGA